jgi:PncC family amidohydrolase
VKQLGVSQDILDTEGAVSDTCVMAMAAGARKHLGTTYALATSGIAGPDGGTDISTSEWCNRSQINARWYSHSKHTFELFNGN